LIQVDHGLFLLLGVHSRFRLLHDLRQFFALVRPPDLSTFGP
jgi:hypothetical protein